MTGRDLLEGDALRAFATFAEHRNFTTAAAALHISQPSLHVKIRKLSAALGTALYERDGRHLRLTASGERLAAYASDNRRRLDRFMLELHQELPALCIAVGRGALRWVIAEPIRSIGRHGRRVQVITADRDAALAAVSGGRADLAVVAYDPPPRQYQSTEIARYHQNLMIDSQHPLAARGRVRLAHLDGLNLVVPSPERAHRRALDRALRQADVSWHVAAEVDGWDLLVHLAQLGMGATVVNSCVPAPAGLTAVPITDLPHIPYWAAWRPPRQGLVDAVLHHLRPGGAAAAVGTDPSSA